MAIFNGGFETGTFSDWRTIGDTSIDRTESGTAPNRGTYQALLTNGFSDSNASVEDSDLEKFLDLAPGVLDRLGKGLEGSAIKQTFKASAGDILTFDWNFFTNEFPLSVLNNFAFFTLTPLTPELADTGKTSVFPLTPFWRSLSEGTGFQPRSVTIPETGTYTLGLGVVGDGNSVVELSVDNIKLIASGNDPFGDTFGFGSPQPDIKSVSGAVSDGNLNLTADFFTPIAAPSTGLPDAVTGFWDLDLDQDPLTGVSSRNSLFAPPDQEGGPLGTEVYIDLFSEQSHPGFVDLVDSISRKTIGSAPITYEQSSYEIQIPLSILGDDGNLYYRTVSGNLFEPTDVAPNTALGTVSNLPTGLLNSTLTI